MKPEKDEFEGLGLFKCVVEKNISVAMHAADVLFSPLCIILGIVILSVSIYCVWPLLPPVILMLITVALANPVIAFIVSWIIILESCCVAWCIRHRRQKRLQKEDADDECPLVHKEED